MAIPRRDIDASFKNFPNLISEFKWDVGGNIGPSFFGIDADHVKEIQSQSPEFGPILVRINKHAQHVELVLNHIPNPLASIESQVPTNVFTELKKEIDEIHQSIGSRVEEIENREVLIGDEVVSIDGQVKVLIDRINTINRDEVALGLAPSADIVDLQNQVGALQARKTDLLKELSLLSEEKNVLAIFFSNFYDPQTAQRAINVIRVNRHRRDAAKSRQDARDAIANQHIIDKEAKEKSRGMVPRNLLEHFLVEIMRLDKNGPELRLPDVDLDPVEYQRELQKRYQTIAEFVLTAALEDIQSQIELKTLTIPKIDLKSIAFTVTDETGANRKATLYDIITSATTAVPNSGDFREAGIAGGFVSKMFNNVFEHLNNIIGWNALINPTVSTGSQQSFPEYSDLQKIYGKNSTIFNQDFWEDSARLPHLRLRMSTGSFEQSHMSLGEQVFWSMRETVLRNRYLRIEPPYMEDYVDTDGVTRKRMVDPPVDSKNNARRKKIRKAVAIPKDIAADEKRRNKAALRYHPIKKGMLGFLKPSGVEDWVAKELVFSGSPGNLIVGGKEVDNPYRSLFPLTGETRTSFAQKQLSAVAIVRAWLDNRYDNNDQDPLLLQKDGSQFNQASIALGLALPDVLGEGPLADSQVALDLATGQPIADVEVELDPVTGLPRLLNPKIILRVGDSPVRVRQQVIPYTFGGRPIDRMMGIGKYANKGMKDGGEQNKSNKGQIGLIQKYAFTFLEMYGYQGKSYAERIIECSSYQEYLEKVDWSHLPAGATTDWFNHFGLGAYIAEIFDRGGKGSLQKFSKFDLEKHEITVDMSSINEYFNLVDSFQRYHRDGSSSQPGAVDRWLHLSIPELKEEMRRTASARVPRWSTLTPAQQESALEKLAVKYQDREQNAHAENPTGQFVKFRVLTTRVHDDLNRISDPAKKKDAIKNYKKDKTEYREFPSRIDQLMQLEPLDIARWVEFNDWKLSKCVYETDPVSGELYCSIVIDPARSGKKLELPDPQSLVDLQVLYACTFAPYFVGEDLVDADIEDLLILGIMVSDDIRDMVVGNKFQGVFSAAITTIGRKFSREFWETIIPQIPRFKTRMSDVKYFEFLTLLGVKQRNLLLEVYEKAQGKKS